MSIDQQDQDYINTVVKKLISSRKSTDDKDNNEYLLHLYDQLWENMRAKENRLWSFLSLYGAAVGLVFAGGQASGLPGAELFVLIIVMGLTTWAVLIILNANYWIRRNLLMVRGIEKRFPGIELGIYPREFPEEKRGNFDTLYRGSILVLCVLLLLFFARTIWPYRSPTSFDTFHIFLSIVLLYVLFTGTVLYCLRQHEDYTALHYATKREQLLKAEQFKTLEWSSVLENELVERKRLSGRLYLLPVLLFVAGSFDLILIRNGYTSLYGIFPQVLLIIAFICHWYMYRRPYEITTALAPLRNADTELATELDTVKHDWEELKSAPGKSVGLKKQFDALADRVDVKISSLENTNDASTFQSHFGKLMKHVQSLRGLDDPAINVGLDNMISDLKRIEELHHVRRARAEEVDNIADGPLNVKWYKPASIKITVGLVLLSTIHPIYFFCATKPKLREDFMGEVQAVSITDLSQQIEKAQQELKKIQNLFQEAQNVELQKKLVDQRLDVLQQQLDKLESQQREMLKLSASPIPKGTP